MKATDARWKVGGWETPVERLKKALEAISYLPNGVAAWVEAHGGNRALADKNAKMVRQAEELLSTVLASMPAAVTYMVVGLEQQPLHFKTREELIKGLEKYDIKHRGESDDSTRFRAELRGQPQFDGLVGPMYGGAGVARYETDKEYGHNFP